MSPLCLLFATFNAVGVISYVFTEIRLRALGENRVKGKKSIHKETFAVGYIHIRGPRDRTRQPTEITSLHRRGRQKMEVKFQRLTAGQLLTLATQSLIGQRCANAYF